MIDPNTYIVFIGTCVVFGLIPGPNVALTVANSIKHGTRYGLVSVAGAISAMVPQLTVTVLGATTLLVLAASAFEWIRWLGVAYLLYLGIKHWFLEAEEELEIKPDRRAKAYKNLYWTGFWVSATNPKSLLFFGAFLPQFVSPENPVMPQMAMLSVTLVTIVAIVDCGWAVLAGQVRPYLAGFARLRHRISGAFFITASVGLAFARKP